MAQSQEQAEQVFGIIDSIAGKFLSKRLTYGGCVRADAQRPPACASDNRSSHLPL